MSDVSQSRWSQSAIALVLAAVMCSTAAAGFAARPGLRATPSLPGISLEAVVPKTFAGWRALPEQTSLIVNPQVEAALYGLYSQVLTRTYVDGTGYRVMLSLAYNEDQRGGLQTHRPEVCYPAQGFKINSSSDARVLTPFGDIEARRLTTARGPRAEPVTYWLTVGNQVVSGRFNKRLTEIRMSLTGQIPDGMLFRISSIDNDPQRAFAEHQRFAADMMGAVPLGVRKQLSGLSTQPRT